MQAGGHEFESRYLHGNIFICFNVYLENFIQKEIEILLISH